jgi:hypothetical protein
LQQAHNEQQPEGEVLMILDVVGAGASWDAKRLHVAFDVSPEGHSRIELKTGEIFQSGRYAAFKKEDDKAIAAKLYVAGRERNAAGQELPSAMCYMKRGEERSEVWFIWRLPDDVLEDFRALFLSGRMPTRAAVFFPPEAFASSGAFEFGWAPDGSMQKWDNEKKPVVQFNSVSLTLDLPAPSVDRPLDAKVPDDDDRAFFTDTARVNFAMLHKLAAIEASMCPSWNFSSPLSPLWGMLNIG